MSISIATLVKMLIYWVFLSQSFFWITVASFWRLLKKLFGNRSLNVNPFKHAHQDVFKSRSIFIHKLRSSDDSKRIQDH